MSGSLGNGTIANLARSSGRLARIIVAPCSVPTVVWVESAFPALLKAIYSYESPDPKHVYHMVAGHSLICSLKQEIRNAREAAGAEEGEGLRFLFKLAETVDKAIWWLFLAGLGVDAFIDWTSMAYELAGCRGPDGSNSSDNPFGGIPDVTHAGDGNGLQWLTGNPETPSFGASVGVRPGHSFTLIWLCNGKDIHSKPAPITAEFRNETIGTVLDQHTGVLKGDHYEATTVAWQARNENNETCIYSVNAWGSIITDSHLVLPSGGFCHRGGG